MPLKTLLGSEEESVGTLVTVELGAVAHRSSVLSESLDRALEAFTLCNCSSVDLVALCEDISLDLVAELIICSVFKFEFLYVLFDLYAGLVEVTLHRLAYAVAVSNFLLAALVNCGDACLRLAEADLNCFVAVVLNGLDLCYDTGACLENCYRDECSVFPEDLSHADLGSHNSFLHLLPLSAGLRRLNLFLRSVFL